MELAPDVKKLAPNVKKLLALYEKSLYLSFLEVWFASVKRHHEAIRFILENKIKSSLGGDDDILVPAEEQEVSYYLLGIKSRFLAFLKKLQKRIVFFAFPAVIGAGFALSDRVPVRNDVQILTESIFKQIGGSLATTTVPSLEAIEYEKQKLKEQLQKEFSLIKDYYKEEQPTWFTYLDKDVKCYFSNTTSFNKLSYLEFNQKELRKWDEVKAEAEKAEVLGILLKNYEDFAISSINNMNNNYSRLICEMLIDIVRQVKILLEKGNTEPKNVLKKAFKMARDEMNLRLGNLENSKRATLQQSVNDLNKLAEELKTKMNSLSNKTNEYLLTAEGAEAVDDLTAEAEKVGTEIKENEAMLKNLNTSSNSLRKKLEELQKAVDKELSKNQPTRSWVKDKRKLKSSIKNIKDKLKNLENQTKQVNSDIDELQVYAGELNEQLGKSLWHGKLRPLLQTAILGSVSSSAYQYRALISNALQHLWSMPKKEILVTINAVFTGLLTDPRGEFLRSMALSFFVLIILPSDEPTQDVNKFDISSVKEAEFLSKLSQDEEANILREINGLYDKLEQEEHDFVNKFLEVVAWLKYFYKPGARLNELIIYLSWPQVDINNVSIRQIFESAWKEKNNYSMIDYGVSSFGWASILYLMLREKPSERLINGGLEKVNINKFLKLFVGDSEAYLQSFIKSSDDKILTPLYVVLFNQKENELDIYRELATGKIINSEGGSLNLWHRNVLCFLYTICYAAEDSKKILFPKDGVDKTINEADLKIYLRLLRHFKNDVSMESKQRQILYILSKFLQTELKLVRVGKNDVQEEDLESLDENQKREKNELQQAIAIYENFSNLYFSINKMNKAIEKFPKTVDNALKAATFLKTKLEETFITEEGEEKEINLNQMRVVDAVKAQEATEKANKYVNRSTTNKLAKEAAERAVSWAVGTLAEVQIAVNAHGEATNDPDNQEKKDYATKMKNEAKTNASTLVKYLSEIVAAQAEKQIKSPLTSIIPKVNKYEYLDYFLNDSEEIWNTTSISKYGFFFLKDESEGGEETDNYDSGSGEQSEESGSGEESESD